MVQVSCLCHYWFSGNFIHKALTKNTEIKMTFFVIRELGQVMVPNFVMGESNN